MTSPELCHSKKKKKKPFIDWTVVRAGKGLGSAGDSSHLTGPETNGFDQDHIVNQRQNQDFCPLLSSLVAFLAMSCARALSPEWASGGPTRMLTLPGASSARHGPGCFSPGPVHLFLVLSPKVEGNHSAPEERMECSRRGVKSSIKGYPNN